MRAALPILALCVAAFAASARAQDAPASVDTEEASMAPIDELLAATRVGEHYDKFFGLLFAEPLPAGAGSDAFADQQLLRRVFERSPWRRIGDEWRKALAERISPRQAKAIVAFYRSDAGSALQRCFDAARTPGEMIDCENGVEGPHAGAIAEYMRSEEGGAFKRGMTEIVDLLMPVALRRTLTEDPALAADVATMCRRRARLPVCSALPSSPGGEPAP
ncbi:MAG: hypothetical protein ACOY82_09625 [Pseudomonadota bacterium]